MPREDEIHARPLQALDRVSGVVDHVPLAAGAGHRQQMVMKHEDPQLGRRGKLLLDPAVAAMADLAVIEVGLGRIDSHDGHAPLPQHRVAPTEQLLEMHVADVAANHDSPVAQAVHQLDPQPLAVDVTVEVEQVGLDAHRVAIIGEGRVVADADRRRPVRCRAGAHARRRSPAGDDAARRRLQVRGGKPEPAAATVAAHDRALQPRWAAEQLARRTTSPSPIRSRIRDELTGSVPHLQQRHRLDREARALARRRAASRRVPWARWP